MSAWTARAVWRCAGSPTVTSAASLGWQDPDVPGDVTFQEYVDREGGVEVRWLSDQHFGFTSLNVCPK